MEQGHLSRDLKDMKDVNLHRVLKKRASTGGLMEGGGPRGGAGGLRIPRALRKVTFRRGLKAGRVLQKDCARGQERTVCGGGGGVYGGRVSLSNLTPEA